MYVAYLRRREDNPLRREQWFYDLTSETEWPEKIKKIFRLQIVLVNDIDRYRVFKLMFQHLINSLIIPAAYVISG